eukprot:gene3921-7132_t
MDLQLELDSRIRDWVLFPILITMFLFGVIRNYLTNIFGNSNKKKNIEKFRQGQTLKKSNDLKIHGKFIPKDSFKIRRNFFFNDEKTIIPSTVEGEEPEERKGGLLNEKIPAQTLSAMTDPSAMGDLMKNNMAMIVPNMVIFGWLSYFYSSFVLAKFPFQLTQKFKGMVQRGLNLNSLDVSYVTSSSIFFLFLFGSNGVFSLIFGNETVDDAKLMQNQMTGGLQQQQQQMKLKI